MVLAPELLIPLIPLLLAFAYYASRAGMFQWMGSAIDALRINVPVIRHVVNAVADALDAVLHYIEAKTADAARAIEAKPVAFLLRLAALIDHTAWTIFYVAARTLHALDTLRSVELPRLLRAAVADLEAGRLHVGRAVKTLERTIAHDVAALERQARGIMRDVGRAVRVAEAAIAKATAGAISRPLPWIDKRAAGAEAAAQSALNQLRGVRGLLAGGVLGALILRALTRAGVGNIRCGNLRRFERNVCGMDPALLDSLLADSLLIFGGISLVEFAKECQAVTEEVAGLIHRFVRAT